MYSIIDGTSTHLDEAARLWAEATSTRDGDDAVAPLEISRPVIQRVLDNSSRAFCSSSSTPTQRPSVLPPQRRCRTMRRWPNFVMSASARVFGVAVSADT